jgi:hypothetical protein
MTDNHKATAEQWKKVEGWASVLSPMSADSACILELRARVAKLEAKANHIGDINKMVPPPEPPSLKKQALEALERMAQFPTIKDKFTICNALEKLND